MGRSLFSSNALPAGPGAWRAADGDYGRSAEPNWRSVDWPAHLRFEQVGGQRVNVLDVDDAGSGGATPAVFVHGLSGCWQNFLENIPRVAQSRRVVALDLPGFGDSELPRERISISYYAGVVQEVCERLSLERVAVVGNSMAAS